MSVIAMWMMWAASTVAGAAPYPGLLTPREAWNDDFTNHAPATAACPGGSLEQVRSTLRVRGPLQPDHLEGPLSPAVLTRLRTGDALYAFEAYVNQPGTRPWGFAGHLVAHGDCIVHAETTGYDN